MSVLEEVLMEEYDRSLRISRAIESENDSLPRGSIRRRIINGRAYFYLQYREGSHVRSKYLKADEVEEIRLRLERRRENDAALKAQAKSRAQIVKALGKEYIDEHSGA